MTTEIAIINRLGVALATDSAVTISGGGRTKVWDTAEKLFMLSSVHPIGIMINGNMDCLGVPWELLIKEFRSSEGGSEKNSVEDWMKDFLAFVERHSSLGADAANRYVEQSVRRRIDQIQRTISDQIREIFDSFRPMPRKKWPNLDISDLLLKQIDVEIKKLDELPTADSLERTDVNDIISGYDDLFEKLITDKFPETPSHQLSSEERGDLKFLLAKHLISITASEYATGLVFAGYGASIFPAVHAVEVDGMVLNKLKYTYVENEVIDGSSGQGRVVSFAQTDVIERLLGGVDPRFVDKTAEFIQESVEKIGNSVEQSMRSNRIRPSDVRKREKLIRDIAELVAKEYQTDVAVELRKKF